MSLKICTLELIKTQALQSCFKYVHMKTYWAPQITNQKVLQYQSHHFSHSMELPLKK